MKLAETKINILKRNVWTNCAVDRHTVQVHANLIRSFSRV